MEEDGCDFCGYHLDVPINRFMDFVHHHNRKQLSTDSKPDHVFSAANLIVFLVILDEVVDPAKPCDDL